MKTTDENELQHIAFPRENKSIEGLEAESLGVYEYLNRVQKEAEALQCIERREKQPQDTEVEPEIEPQDTHTKTTTQPPQKQWQLQLLYDFTSSKQLIPTITPSATKWKVPSNASHWRKYITENPPPSFLDLLTLDHTTAIKLIVYFTSWLSGTVNDNLSRWIYTIFLRLDGVLDSNDSSMMRALAKKAIKVYYKQSTTKSDVTDFTCEMIVTIVREYYGQRDLSLEREEQ